MTKKVYTESFEKFWKAYPRRVGKMGAFKSWQSHVDETDAFLPKAVIDDIEKRNRLRFWHADKSKIPMPSTFLNQHRWEDEDWEDEIKTRGKENMATYTAMPMPTVKIDEPQLNGWEMMCNRLMRSYLFKAGGFTDAQLKIFVKAKHRVLKQFLSAIDEELSTAANADEVKKIKQEMGTSMAQTLMSNLDHDLGLHIGQAIINQSRRKHHATR